MPLPTLSQRLTSTEGMSVTPVTLGIIGGSGLYEIDALTDRADVNVETPFGAPSDLIVTGQLGGLRVAFLPRQEDLKAAAHDEVSSRTWACL